MKENIDYLGNIGIVVEDWDINNSYRPRTITTDYSSWISYISRKPVPPGIELTDTEYWKPITRLEAELAFNYEKFKRDINEHMHSLETQMASFMKTASGGTGLASIFGDSEDIGATQKTLTRAINDIYNKIESLTGESTHGISLTCSPDYYIGEEGSTIHITANTVDTEGIFEELQFFINGLPITEKVYNVESFSFDTEIDETVIIMCKAKILGIEYTEQKYITHYDSFWLGGGTVASDVMIFNNLRSISNNMRGSYNITLSEGQKIIIVVGTTLRNNFVRADMNGVEIQFIESTYTDVSNNVYKVLTSENTYQAGTYNIDINS